MAPRVSDLGRTVLLAGCLACAVPLAGAAPAWSARIAGVTLPPTETVGSAQLQLVGCSAREKLWMDLYAVSLYLPREMASVARMTDDGVPKLVRLDVTYDGKVPDGLPSEWKQRLREHVSQEFLQTLEAHYNTLRGGDTVRVSYTPGGGTTLSVNGRTVATRPGGELMNAMLKLWVGPDPVSQDIKSQLLQGSC